MEAKTKKTILVVVRPRSHDVILEALGHHFIVILCGSLGEVQMALHQEVDLIVCGMNFDESRMFDLLRNIKATPSFHSTPFLGMKVAEGMLMHGALNSVDKAARSLGADEFVDFAWWRRELGDEKEYEMLRNTIYRLL